MSGNHEAAIFPDEKAKIYFYPSPLNNPGVQKQGKDKANLFLFCKYGRLSGYFKIVKEYKPKIKRLGEKEQEIMSKETHY